MAHTDLRNGSSVLGMELWGELIGGKQPKRRDTGVDLTTVEGVNPTKSIADNYDALMRIEDPERLRTMAIACVDSGGVSDTNRRKFTLTVTDIGDNIAELQTYLTNYLLRGCGLGTLRTAGSTTPSR